MLFVHPSGQTPTLLSVFNCELMKLIIKTIRVKFLLAHWNIHLPEFDVSLFLVSVRTLTQEDHGDNQITMEDVTQLVSDVFAFNVFL